jgi:hypothetical protein
MLYTKEALEAKLTNHPYPEGLDGEDVKLHTRVRGTDAVLRQIIVGDGGVSQVAEREVVLGYIHKSGYHNNYICWTVTCFCLIDKEGEQPLFVELAPIDVAVSITDTGGVVIITPISEVKAVLGYFQLQRFSPTPHTHYAH